MRKLAPAACAVIAVVAVAGCHVGHIHWNGTIGNKAQDVVSQDFKADKVSVVDVLATSGDITIVPGPSGSNSVTVEATRTVQGMQNATDLEKHLSDVSVTAALKGDALQVRYDVSPAIPHSMSAWVAFRITVPDRLTAKLETSSGDIQVTGIAGAVVASRSGNVKAEHISGPVTVNTTSGDITLTGVTAAGPVTLASSSGDVTLNGVKCTGQNGTLGVTTTSGDMEVTADASVLNVQTSSGGVRATLGSPLQGATIHTTSGDVKLTLAQGQNGSLQAATTSGSLEVDGKSNEDSHTLKQTLGTGGVPLNLETTSGDIEVHTGH